MGDLQSLLSELANYGDVSLISVGDLWYCRVELASASSLGYGRKNIRSGEGNPNPYFAAHKCLERLAN